MYTFNPSYKELLTMNEQYEINFVNIIEEDHEFLEYEEDYLKNILQHEPIQKK